jgi:Suppressor of fused protein (SUFU)
MTLLDHLERHCGETMGGFSELHQEFQVIQLPRGPVKGSMTLATLGLSHHVMHSASGGDKRFRMELVMLFRESDGRRNLPGVLHQAGTEALRHHHGLLRGDVIGPWGPLQDGATVEALYSSAPAYFQESFHVYTPQDGTLPIVLVWLVPITASEAAFVRRAGWNAFETELQRQNPDLLDLRRSAIVLPE